MIKIDKDLVEKVSWEEDPDTFDFRLFALGADLDEEEFLIVNPKFDPWITNYIEADKIKSDSCVVWELEGFWLAKKFKKQWSIVNGWTIIECDLDIEKIVESNTDIKFINQALLEKIKNYKIKLVDLYAEHVWYVDPKIADGDEKIWFAKIRATDVEITEFRHMGFIVPELVYNKDLPDLNYNLEFTLPYYHNDYNYELVWHIDDRFNQEGVKIWLAKFVPDVSQGYKEMGQVSPAIECNPDMPPVDFDADMHIPYQDLVYDHVWYLDSRFKQEEDKIWALRISPKKSLGLKDMGYTAPVIEFNGAVPDVDYDIKINVPYQDLVYEHVWYLDAKFDPADEKVWVAKITPRNSKGTTEVGTVSPLFKFNPDIPNIDFDFDFDLPYYSYDYNYELVWHLDPKFNGGIDDVWAIRLTPHNPKGVKNMGFVSPKIIYNRDIPKLNYSIKQSIPYYELNYEHVWMLPSNLHNDSEKIWAAKILPKGKSLGVKEIGDISVELDNFDVVFISYKEPNAEENWKRLLKICPTAKRVKNVKGIFEAHKAAAELVTTDMFYVVDGDARLVNGWKFDFRPNVFDMDCVHLWTSLNPINNLEYGYGGVKLFPRQMLLDAKTWNLDLTTGLGKLKLINKISNVTAFNYDPFNTWRSAFRECVKLALSKTAESEQRLNVWCTEGLNRKNGRYAIDGARRGYQYAIDHADDPDNLKLINDYDWMKNEFNRFH